MTRRSHAPRELTVSTAEARRTAGIPLVQAPPPAHPRTIAIVMLSAIGDAVHVLPVANALRRTWPKARITWIIQPGPHALVRGHAAVDEFIVFRRRGGLEAWRSYAELRNAVGGRTFDLVLALQVYFKAGLITALLRSPFKLGFDRARARDLNWLFTTHRIAPHPPQHVQDQYFEFLYAIGVDPEPVEWGIRLTDEERAARAAFFAKLERPVCAIVVGTSKRRKNWAPERCARIIDALHLEFGMRTLLVGGPSMVEREMADRILAHASVRPIDTLGNELRRLVYLIAGSDLVISPDTGPLHIARALDVPVIGLYGYTNPKRTGPYRKYADLVVDGYARYPGEDYPVSMDYRPEGMDRVTVEAVLEKVELAAKQYPRSPGGDTAGG
ncbi:MAG: glycosyltransferase family 9 protein [Gemmatimonadetes bacterium]|nr:glycosyltransferase family 9 protein [Gemmatimonadota bacterium]